MRLKVKLILGVILALLALSVFVLPALAGDLADWWNPTVDLKVPVRLEPYKGSYWVSMLFPGWLDCQSASLTIGTILYPGDIKQHWWWFRSCEVTFSDVPANTTGIFTINYKANANWSYHKTVSIGKTWLSTLYTPKVFLPWMDF